MRGGYLRIFLGSREFTFIVSYMLTIALVLSSRLGLGRYSELGLMFGVRTRLPLVDSMSSFDVIIDREIVVKLMSVGHEIVQSKASKWVT